LIKGGDIIYLPLVKEAGRDFSGSFERHRIYETDYLAFLRKEE